MRRFLSPRRPLPWALLALASLVVWTPPASPHPFVFHPGMPAGGVHPAMMHPGMGHAGTGGVHPALLQYHQQTIAHQLAHLQVHLQTQLHAQHAHLLAMHQGQPTHAALLSHGTATRSNPMARNPGHSGHPAQVRVSVDVSLSGHRPNHSEARRDHLTDVATRVFHGVDHVLRRDVGRDREHSGAAPRAPAPGPTAPGPASVAAAINLLQGQLSAASAVPEMAAFPFVEAAMVGEGPFGPFGFFMAAGVEPLAFPEVFPLPPMGAAALLLGEGNCLETGAEACAFLPPA